MIVADSTKQKVNARSSTESELIGVDDRISNILWTHIVTTGRSEERRVVTI